MTSAETLTATERAYTCLIWTLTRRDGVTLRMTDHDKPLSIESETFEPGLSLSASRFTQTTSLTGGEASVDGVLSSDGITDSDIRAGAWDRAHIKVELADWGEGARIALVWSGRFSDIRTDGEAFSADLVSLKGDLDRVLGRNYARLCDAVLGDARCGVDLTDPQYAGQTCDQRFETCVDRFANGERFRGCPHMPGNDFMLAAPGRAGRS